MSSKDFCDGLRKGAKVLASGEREYIYLRDLDIESALGDDAERVKITPAYIRTTMNRVAEVKELGSVSVRRVTGDPELPDGYRITIVKETRRKVFTDKELPGIKAKAANKVIRDILQVSPDLSHLEPQGVVVAVDTIKRFKDLIRDMFGVKEDE